MCNLQVLRVTHLICVFLVKYILCFVSIWLVYKDSSFSWMVWWTLLPKPNALHSTLLLFNFEITVASKKNNERLFGNCENASEKKKFFFQEIIFSAFLIWKKTIALYLAIAFEEKKNFYEIEKVRLKKISCIFSASFFSTTTFLYSRKFLDKLFCLLCNS